mmetsp:Transcript_42759/g.90905  ORF Transcript_42759/g.90905 Transcript_42759/m.90905 type:complete len:265 (-) Transcript_42759:668-1462(-)
MNFVVERAGWAASAGSRRYERNSLPVIVRGDSLGRFPFRENDEGCPIDVKQGIHRRRALLATCQCQTHVGSLPHAVGRQDAKDGFGNFRSGVDILEPQRLRRTEQSIKVMIQMKYPTVVNTNALPSCIPSLNRGIKRRNRCHITRYNAPRASPSGSRWCADKDQDMFISWILVQSSRWWCHDSPSLMRRGESLKKVEGRYRHPKGREQIRGNGTVSLCPRVVKTIFFALFGIHIFDVPTRTLPNIMIPPLGPRTIAFVRAGLPF